MTKSPDTAIRCSECGHMNCEHDSPPMTEPNKQDELDAEKFAEDLCPSDLHAPVGEQVPIRKVWLYRGFLEGRASLRAEIPGLIEEYKEALMYLVNGSEMTLEANQEDIECRGDEDCDHCVLLSAIHNAKLILNPKDST